MQSDLFSGNWELTESNETLEDIKQEMVQKAKQIPEIKDEVFVFSQGKPNAKVAVVGESPGPPDADSGLPFQGPTGDLLNKILSSIGLNRHNTYLTNIVKYISPGDELTPDIINFFTPYVFRELAIVKPKVVIALGNTPAQALLNTKQRISKIRGEFQQKDGFTIMPTFNPAYLLRDASKKREVWEDMKQVRDFLKNESK